MRYSKNELENINLKKLRPDLAKQWHYGKNKPLRPEDVSINSHKKVWWKCGKRHTWQATVAARARNGYGCPVCTNRVVLPGYNDLATLRPEVAAQWNYEKNGELKPTQVTPGCNKRVWWKCEKGHEFEGKINDRTRKNRKCPICTNRIILPGYNDLETLRPDIAAEWARWINKLKPSEVGEHSNKKVWWHCYNNHFWEAKINDRTKKHKGTGCPYCAKKRKWKKQKNNLKIRRKILTKNLFIDRI